MKSHPHKRRILIINPQVQFKLIGFGSLWATGGALFASFVARITFNHLTEGTEVPRSVILIIGVCGVVMFALAVLLSMYLSNRIAGPLFRLHREIKRLADGERAEPIRPREGDMYQDLMLDFNRLLERMNQTGTSDA